MFSAKKILLVIVLLFVAGAAVVFASRFSMPGDALYSVKTGVLESLQYPQSGGSATSLDNSVTLFENRLQETQELIVRQTLATSSAEALQLQLNSQVKTFAKNVEADDTDVVAALSRAVTIESVTRAIDALTYKEVSDGIQDEFINMAEDVTNIQIDLRDRVIEAGTSTVTMYFNEQVNEISTMLSSEVVTDRSVSDIATFVEKAGAMYAQGRYERALSFINEAKKAAELRLYLRLPVNDAAPEPDLSGEG